MPGGTDTAEERPQQPQHLLSGRRSAFKPAPVPQWTRFHHFPVVYLAAAVAVYFYIQSDTAERVHGWCVERGGAFAAVCGFGTALFVCIWQAYGAVQALMDAYPYWLWSQFKAARLDALRYGDILPNVLWNQLCVAPVFLWCLHQFSVQFLGARGFDVTWQRLSLPVLVLQVVANYIVYEALFYGTHRLLHVKALYRFHKQHHLTYGTVGVSGSYMGTLDFVLTQMVPIALPPVVLGTHFTSMLFPLCIGAMNSIQSHGSYCFPVRYHDPTRDAHELIAPFPSARAPAQGMPTPDDHLTHHLQPHRNFGTGLFDWLFGTD